MNDTGTPDTSTPRDVQNPSDTGTGQNTGQWVLGYYVGYDIRFAPGYLKTLYPTHRDYVTKVATDVHKLVTQYWLTDYDGDRMIREAEAADIPAA